MIESTSHLILIYYTLRTKTPTVTKNITTTKTSTTTASPSFVLTIGSLSNRKAKRATKSYIGASGGEGGHLQVVSSKSKAAKFILSGNHLIANNLFVSTTQQSVRQGYSALGLFKSANKYSTKFTSPSTGLLWANSAFAFNGKAEFCVKNNIIYAKFKGPESFGCTDVVIRKDGGNTNAKPVDGKFANIMTSR